MAPIDPTLAAVMTMFSQMQAAQEERQERREAERETQEREEERRRAQQERDGDMKNYYSLSQDQCQQQIPLMS